MSSLPLISHHLFVAAVKKQTRASRRAVDMGPRPSLRESPARDIPLELLDFGRPLPLEAAQSTNVLFVNSPT